MRIERGAPGTTFDRAHLFGVRAQVQPTHELPDRSRWVVLCDQLLNVHRPQKQLCAIDHLQSSLRHALSLITAIIIGPFSRTR